MLDFNQLARFNKSGQRPLWLLMVLFALLIGTSQCQQTSVSEHHFDASVSSIEYERETEISSLDGPIFSSGLSLSYSSGVLVSLLPSRTGDSDLPSTSYIQPLSRAPPIA